MNTSRNKLLCFFAIVASVGFMSHSAVADWKYLLVSGQTYPIEASDAGKYGVEASHDSLHRFCGEYVPWKLNDMNQGSLIPRITNIQVDDDIKGRIETRCLAKGDKYWKFFDNDWHLENTGDVSGKCYHALERSGMYCKYWLK